MFELKVNILKGYSVCKSDLLVSKESYDNFKYIFKSGKIYFIKSNLNGGNWGVINAIAGNYETLEGSIELDNKKLMKSVVL